MTYVWPKFLRVHLLQAFYLYIRAKNWSDKDEFELYSDGDYYDLVEEAKNMEL